MSTSDFANQVLADWDHAMDEFFSRVDHKRRDRGLKDSEVRWALYRGYGSEVADAWIEWTGGDS